MPPVTNTELSKQLSSLEARLGVIESTLQRHDEHIEEVTRVLRGANGNVGLVAKIISMETLERSVHLTCPIKDVHSIVYGDKGVPGLLEEVRKLQEWKNNITRLYWLVLASLTASLITLAIDIFRH